MSFRIHYELSVADELTEIYRRIARQSSTRAEAWLNGLIGAVDTLTSFPHRCPLAPESDDFDIEIRYLLYGQFRVLFTIEDGVVRVLHVRHGSRRYLNPDEIE